MRKMQSLLGLSSAMLGLMASAPIGRSSHHRRKKYIPLNPPGHKSKPSKKRLKVKLARKQKHRK